MVVHGSADLCCLWEAYPKESIAVYHLEVLHVLLTDPVSFEDAGSRNYGHINSRNSGVFEGGPEWRNYRMRGIRV